jgi:glycosyltransferase involved in cell wall biosynthesis
MKEADNTGTEMQNGKQAQTQTQPQGRPILWIVIPCYNEEAVLPVTAPMFRSELAGLIRAGKISDRSRILFVNDGSRDSTWDIITGLSKQDPHFIGISAEPQPRTPERGARRPYGGERRNATSRSRSTVTDRMTSEAMGRHGR